MDAESVQPILDELFSSLEPLDAQSSAVLQFLKSKGLATDEELAPFLKQAADAASVRWLAVRIRAAAMIANLVNPPQEGSFNTPAEKNVGSAPKKINRNRARRISVRSRIKRPLMVRIMRSRRITEAISSRGRPPAKRGTLQTNARLPQTTTPKTRPEPSFLRISHL